MKAKCNKILDNSGKQQTASEWLTVGKEYTVLEIETSPGKDVLYRLVGDNEDESPALYDSAQFEIASNKIPSNWIIYQVNALIIQGPEAWQRPDFWEECYDSEPAALEVYRREA